MFLPVLYAKRSPRKCVLGRDESLGSYGLHVVSPQVLYAETLTPVRCIRKRGVFLEVIRVRLGNEGGDHMIGSVFLF